MGARSSIDRLGHGFRARLEEAFEGGATIDEITAGLNEALAEMGRSERISRSAVGRAVQGLEPILRIKRRADEVMGALAEQPSEGRRELVRTLIVEAGLAMADGTQELTPAQARELSSALLNVERSGEIDDKRIALAERRARDAERRRTREALSEAGADGRLDAATADRALAILGFA